MPLQSINPATGEKIAEFPELTSQEIEAKLVRAGEAFAKWRNTTVFERAVLMKKAGEILKANAEKYARLMTLEMGKPVTQGIAEAQKCAFNCDYYVEKAAEFLEPEVVETEAGESYVQYDPLGIVLGVMPWNFPFWQVFRAAVPILMGGNVMVLKHASNVPQCAMECEKIFLEAGFPEGVFQYLAIGSSKVEGLISDDRIVAVTLTGSEYAGSKVAEQCGREIKKTVLELGGSSPFVVLEDADIDYAAHAAVTARFQNCGQSCIAAKRFIVMESVYEEFLEKFKTNLEAWKFGNPDNKDVQIGPLYSLEGRETLEGQLEGSVKMGARVVSGGHEAGATGAFFQPTILADASEEMPVFKEETFGPLAAVIKVSTTEEAIRIANNTRYGLSASIFTRDLEKAKKLAKEFECGAVFVNDIVKSDPRLPVGGVKKSGYGRELAKEGIREFTNIKTVWVK